MEKQGEKEPDEESPSSVVERGEKNREEMRTRV